MSLTDGTRIGAYEVVAAIGAGGMGEVYRARDTKLQRDVALKILPQAFATDAERLARFEREAHVLAALNHPNIAGIYGVEESGDLRALVMELVEGETLADRIARGAIPLDEALPIARQIADALEAAHEQGIVHRDLKPANIKVRHDGTVKVLDFGLAKLTPPAGAAPASVTMSPTITSPALATGVGVLLGTAAYMSPEQAKGREADKRSDIWAFGCVLYEMLTGKRAFDGEDVSDTLAAVLRGNLEWNALPVDSPPAVRALIKSCLERDLRQRISDIAAVQFVLRHPALGTPSDGVTKHMPARVLWRRVGAALIVVTGASALGVLLGRSTAPAGSPPLVTRFTYTLPADQRFSEVGGQIVAVSADGSNIAYIANRRIYLKSASEWEARPIAGTEVEEGIRLTTVMFSPDSQSVGFWLTSLTSSPFKRVPLAGGTPVTVTQLSTYGLMATWRADGLIGADRDLGIVRVAPNGQRDLLVKITDGLIAAPQLLPDGDTLLYAIAPGVTDPTGAPPDTWDKARIVIRSLTSGEEKTLVDGGGAPTYVRGGYLLYVVGGTLFAAPFDYRQRALTGSPIAVVEGVARPVFTNAAPPTVYYALSDSGTLVYVPGPALPSTGQFELALVSTEGRVERLKLRPGSYLFPRLSPDGKQVAFGTEDARGTNVWVHELSGTTAVRQLTFGGKNRYPVWSSDGVRVAFQSDREGDLAIFVQRADGSAPAERLTRPSAGVAHVPESWSPDGKTLLYSESKSGEFELWSLTLPEKKSLRVGDVRSTLDPPAAQFSPDGKWLTYLTTDSKGGRTVFVEPFPSNGVKHLIGTSIWHPIWSSDGSRLFYRASGTREYVVRVTTKPAFAISDPELLAASPYQSRGRVEREYDVAADGRFIGIVPAAPPQSGSVVQDSRSNTTNGSPFGTAQQINVVVNWMEELKQRVPLK